MLAHRLGAPTHRRFIFQKLASTQYKGTLTTVDFYDLFTARFIIEAKIREAALHLPLPHFHANIHAMLIIAS